MPACKELHRAARAQANRLPGDPDIYQIEIAQYLCWVRWIYIVCESLEHKYLCQYAWWRTKLHANNKIKDNISAVLIFVYWLWGTRWIGAETERIGKGSKELIIDKSLFNKRQSPLNFFKCGETTGNNACWGKYNVGNWPKFCRPSPASVRLSSSSIAY